MGTPGFDLGLQAAQQRTLERQRIAEQQRVEQQNTVGAQLLDAINNASNVKDTRKNPDTGALEHNPEYDTAQQAKQQLLTQYVGLNSPAQHASFGQRLHGLIFGHPTDQQREPALNSAAAADQSNVAPPSPVQAAGEAVGDVGDTTPHPMATSHPVLDKMHAGVEALKNHLSAFAHPLPPQPQPDANLIAQYYRDPGEVAFERSKELWGERGAVQLEIADKRLQAMLARTDLGKPQPVGDFMTIPSLIAQMDQDPDLTVAGPDGHAWSKAQLMELPTGTVAHEYMRGHNLITAFGDPKMQKWSVGGVDFEVPRIGTNPAEQAISLGTSNAALPKSSTDQYGNVTTHTTATPGMAVAPPAATSPAAAGPAGPVSSAAPPLPTLKTRPTAPAGAPAALPTATPLAQINAGIASANAASPKLNKGRPVSSAAPQPPSANLPALEYDAEGYGKIPDSAGGNAQVRQFANDLLNDRDTDKIPAKARASAEALASRYGWSQGAFTPREMKQMLVARAFLTQLQNSDSLKVLDNLKDRTLIAQVMADSQEKGKGLFGNFVDQAILSHLPAKDAEFIRQFNAASGSVQGMSSVTRQGRATMGIVNLLRQELPNILQSASSADAKARIDNLLKEASWAQLSNKELKGEGGPISRNAPPPPGQSKGDVSVAEAMKLDVNKGKSEDEVKADLKAKGYNPVK